MYIVVTSELEQFKLRNGHATPCDLCGEEDAPNSIEVEIPADDDTEDETIIIYLCMNCAFHKMIENITSVQIAIEVLHTAVDNLRSTMREFENMADSFDTEEEELQE